MMHSQKNIKLCRLK